MGSLDELQFLCEGKSIAIVGNAQSLFTQKRAAEIDAHDIVVRMNKSVLAEPSVQAVIGFRCDIYTASGVGLVPLEYHRTQQPQTCYYMTTRKRETAPTYFNFFPEEMWEELQRELCLNKDEEARPSTGIMTIYMILKTVKYKQVDIYGFDFWNTKTFYNPTLSVAATHNPSYEKEYVEKLLKQHDNVNFIGVKHENCSI